MITTIVRPDGRTDRGVVCDRCGHVSSISSRKALTNLCRDCWHVLTPIERLAWVVAA